MPWSLLLWSPASLYELAVYSVDELLKTFIFIFEERWEAKEQDSDQHGQRRHAIAFPIWKFSQVFWGGFICCCRSPPSLTCSLTGRRASRFPARYALS